MLYSLLKTAHVLAIVVWVGGMVFAHFFLRPSLTVLEAPQRLRLMREVLGRFFAAVTLAVVVALVTGLAMMLGASAATPLTLTTLPLGWWIMGGVGTVMIAIFAVIRGRFFAALQRALDAGELPAAGAALGQIRRWVGVNLTLGVAVLVVAVSRWPQ